MADGLFVALDGAAARPLAGEVQSLEQPPHARLRIPLAADLLDELADARERPQIGGISLALRRRLRVQQPTASSQCRSVAANALCAVPCAGRAGRSPQALVPTATPTCGSLGAAALLPPAWHHAAVNAPPLNVAFPVLHHLASCSSPHPCCRNPAAVMWRLLLRLSRINNTKIASVLAQAQ